MHPPPLDKAALRRQALQARKTVVAPDQAADQMTKRLWPLVEPLCAARGASALVGAYWPMRGEIDPRPLLALCHKQGIATALPVVVGKDQPLLFRAWSPGQALDEGAYGTCHPPASAGQVQPCLVLVPLVAFDRTGARLGYGGGFYDRTLPVLRAAQSLVAIGLAHAAQEISAVPREPHDQALDWLATDAEILGPFRR